MRALNRRFHDYQLDKTSDEAFIGSIERRFDFLGRYSSRVPLRMAQKALDKHTLRWHPLYDLHPDKTAP